MLDLTNFIKYTEVIGLIEKKCDYVEIVLLCSKESSELIEMFQDQIIDKEWVTEWSGTRIYLGDDKKEKGNLKIKIKFNNKFLTLIKETGAKGPFNTEDRNYNFIGYLYFPLLEQDDISFYDKDGNLLLFTTTHEGYVGDTDHLYL